ncbi:MAG: hypothetical protein AUG51_05460 [Acidobacteria bacterium 13_1_20CM_3_53_8]|nr:MAG: hypothetical protein AUG51_05460 [Acidobacteria bacterium 13_1_20CM_3_53_8]
MISGYRHAPFSQKLYSLFLILYPAEFRREYGAHMAQLFRDRWRETKASGGASRLRLWMYTLLDLIQSAPKEHLEKLRKGDSIMRALKTIGLAIIIYVVAFVVTGMFLEKMRTQMPFFLGSLIDAIVAVGILFNLIFLILWSTRLMPVARAVIASGIVSALMLGIFLAIIGSIVPANARPSGGAYLSIVLSLFVWFIVHWTWAQRKAQPPATV